MKYVILVPDGAADYPLKELNGKTPLQVAQLPHMDELVRKGLLGTVRTIPSGMNPGSDIANLSILGYDPHRFYTGRGPLEAASMGITLAEDEVAFRCNLVTVSERRLVDYSAGHIPTEEARILIEVVDSELGDSKVKFYAGVSYRHLMVMQDKISDVRCNPPHDVVGSKLEEILPAGKGAEELIRFTETSYQLLEAHPINKKRVGEGKSPANMIWLWGQGKAPAMPTLQEKYGVSGAVISAVDLVKGIGRLAGLKVIEVPGATGYFDTDYAAKAEYAFRSLEEGDFVFVHVEAPDEAGHTRNLQAKIKALEEFDVKIVGYILRALKDYGEFKILLLPDHATPLEVATHTADPVPFVIFDSSQPKSDGFDTFDELTAQKSNMHLTQGFKLMDLFVAGKIEQNS